MSVQYHEERLQSFIRARQPSFPRDMGMKAVAGCTILSQRIRDRFKVSSVVISLDSVSKAERRLP